MPVVRCLNRVPPWLGLFDGQRGVIGLLALDQPAAETRIIPLLTMREWDGQQSFQRRWWYLGIEEIVHNNVFHRQVLAIVLGHESRESKLVFLEGSTA